MSTRIAGERVFCFQCENEWDRAHGGLQCPRCESEFVEILEDGVRPNFDDPPEVTPDDNNDQYDPMSRIRDHNPWGGPPDPDEGDIRTIHFNTGGGGSGVFSFSRTYTTGFGGQQRSFNGSNDPQAEQTMRDFQNMLHTMVGGMGPMRASINIGGTSTINGRTTTFGAGSHGDDFPGMGRPGGPPDLFSMLFPGMPGSGAQRSGNDPFGFLSMLLDPRNARSGDAVYSQEAFDRIMSQLMEQNQGANGAPPASQDVIDNLPTKLVDREMLGNEDKGECSICMDNVEVETPVTILPCQHWFHHECIESWLKEHNTCPQCRQSVTAGSPPSDRPTGTRRRSSRRASSIPTPFAQESPRRVDSDRDRPASERRSSRRSTNSRDDGGGGGVTGWIRSRLPLP